MLWFTKQQLKSRNVATRRRAVDALCRKSITDPRVVEVLLDLLGDSDAEVRCVAITAIGKSDDVCRADAVRRALTDADPSVRNAAILATKRLKDESLVANLAAILQDPDFGVRGSAALALEAFSWRPTNPDEEIRLLLARGQLQRAAAFGAAAIAPLEALLSNGPVSLRPRAVDALSRIDDERALRPIQAALRSGETAVVAAAVDVIGKIGNPDLADSLRGLLRHAEPLVRTTTADALGKLGAVQAWDQIAALLKDSHWDTRRVAADALSRLKDVRAVPALAGALADSDGDVREACAMALGGLRDRSAIAPLVLALGDAASSVRRIAAAALARIDEDWSSSPEAQPALAQLKADTASKPAGLRSAALGGLGLHPHSKPGLAPMVTASSDPEKNQKHAVSLFASILVDVDRDLRVAAAEALGRLGGSRAESALSRALRDPDAGVQAAVELALKKLHPVHPT